MAETSRRLRRRHGGTIPGLPEIRRTGPICFARRKNQKPFGLEEKKEEPKQSSELVMFRKGDKAGEVSIRLHVHFGMAETVR